MAPMHANDGERRHAALGVAPLEIVIVLPMSASTQAAMHAGAPVQFHARDERGTGAALSLILATVDARMMSRAEAEALIGAEAHASLPAGSPLLAVRVPLTGDALTAHGLSWSSRARTGDPVIGDVDVTVPGTRALSALVPGLRPRGLR